MDELQKLVERLGSQIKAARELKVVPSLVSEWLSGKRDVPTYIADSARKSNKILTKSRYRNETQNTD